MDSQWKKTSIRFQLWSWNEINSTRYISDWLIKMQKMENTISSLETFVPSNEVTYRKKGKDFSLIKFAFSINFKHHAIVRRENNCNLLASSVFFSKMIQQLINIHDYLHVRTQNTVVLFMSFFLCSTNHHKTNENETWIKGRMKTQQNNHRIVNGKKERKD